MSRTTPYRNTPWKTRLAALLFGLFVSLAAAAATLDSAKAEGWIGERPDGYLGLVRSDAPADVQAVTRRDPLISVLRDLEIIGDEIERAVSWRNSSDVSKLAGQTVRLRFELKDADLYSFQFVTKGAR